MPKPLGAHEHEIRVRVAIIGDKAKLRLNVIHAADGKVLRYDKTKERAAYAVGAESGHLRFCDRGREMALGNLVSGHPVPSRLVLPACGFHARSALTQLNCIRRIRGGAVLFRQA
jgi:hypothetical protein